MRKTLIPSFLSRSKIEGDSYIVFGDGYIAKVQNRIVVEIEKIFSCGEYKTLDVVLFLRKQTPIRIECVYSSFLSGECEYFDDITYDTRLHYDKVEL